MQTGVVVVFAVVVAVVFIAVIAVLLGAVPMDEGRQRRALVLSGTGRRFLFPRRGCASTGHGRSGARPISRIRAGGLLSVAAYDDRR